MKRMLERGQGVLGGETKLMTRNTYSSVEDIKLQLPLERNA